MPETTLTIKWNNEEVEDIYSPSSIISQYFTTGEKMTMAELEIKSKQAFTHASRRVEEAYGFACSSAHASLSRIIRKIAQENNPDAEVEIVDITQ